MKRTFVFLRHAGQGKNAILDMIAQIAPYKGRNIQVFASSEKDMDPTVRAVEECFEVFATRTHHLDRTAKNFDEVNALLDKSPQAEVVFFVTHSELAATLPHSFGTYYQMTKCPPVQERKPGSVTTIKVSASKIQAAQNHKLEQHYLKKHEKTAAV